MSSTLWVCFGFNNSLLHATPQYWTMACQGYIRSDDRFHLPAYRHDHKWLQFYLRSPDNWLCTAGLYYTQCLKILKTAISVKYMLWFVPVYYQAWYFLFVITVWDFVLHSYFWLCLFPVCACLWIAWPIPVSDFQFLFCVCIYLLPASASWHSEAHLWSSFILNTTNSIAFLMIALIVFIS